MEIIAWGERLWSRRGLEGWHAKSVEMPAGLRKRPHPSSRFLSEAEGVRLSFLSQWGRGEAASAASQSGGEGEASLLRHLLASGRRWNHACCQVARMPPLLPSTTPGVAKSASAPHGAGLRADQEEAEHTGCQAARVTSSTMAQSSPTRVAVCPARHFGQDAFCLREAKV